MANAMGKISTEQIIPDSTTVGDVLPSHGRCHYEKTISADCILVTCNSFLFIERRGTTDVYTSPVEHLLTKCIDLVESSKQLFNTEFRESSRDDIIPLSKHTY